VRVGDADVREPFTTPLTPRQPRNSDGTGGDASISIAFRTEASEKTSETTLGNRLSESDNENLNAPAGTDASPCATV
jgi:hypothetical protein